MARKGGACLPSNCNLDSLKSHNRFDRPPQAVWACVIMTTYNGRIIKINTEVGLIYDITKG